MGCIVGEQGVEKPEPNSAHKLQLLAFNEFYITRMKVDDLFNVCCVVEQEKSYAHKI